MPRAYSQPFFRFPIREAGWSLAVGRASRSSMNHSCCLAHSCLGASGSGRCGAWAKWRGHMAAPDVLLLYMHSSSKTTSPATRESRPSGRQPDSSSPCSPVNYWKAVFRGGKKINKETRAIFRRQPRAALAECAAVRFWAAQPRDVNSSKWKSLIQKASADSSKRRF